MVQWLTLVGVVMNLRLHAVHGIFAYQRLPAVPSSWAMCYEEQMSNSCLQFVCCGRCEIQLV